MGRKGVGKRKPSKSKHQADASKGGNGAATGVATVFETLRVRSVGNGEALTIDKGGERK